MKKVYCSVLALVALVSGIITASAQKLPYQDENLPIEERVADLLGRMTVDEKIDLMRSTSPANPRLGIDKYYHGNEALHGVVRPGRFTVFPQAIGLASSWDPDLMLKVSTAISDEARARWNQLDQGRLQTQLFSDVLTFWSPTVNMARDPRWGRTPETYGEDPFLTGEMGTAFVRGLQGDDPRYLKVVSTPKHFAANNEEHNRHMCNVVVPEKQLREYYLPAYEALVRRGHAASIMASYNAINGVPNSCNPWLLTKVLRNDWGFDGYVVSDCGGVSQVLTAHKFVKNRETAAALCLRAGLDLECGDSYYIKPLKNAYEAYMVTDEDIDRAAGRILTARMRLGLFDSGENNPYTKISPDVIGSEKHRALALQMARESIVLLKNGNGLLPLKKGKVKSIAVVGINAGSCEFGDYSGMPVHAPVSILEGIRTAAGKDIKVNYAPWKSAVDGMEIIAPEYFPGGLKAEYYAGEGLQGNSVTRTEEWINFEPQNQAPDPFLPEMPISVRWSGNLCPNVSGEYEISFTSDDGCRLWIDDQLVIDAWRGHTVRADSFKATLEAGRNYKIVAEYWNNRDYSIARLSWRPPVNAKQDRIAFYGKAGELAAKSDVVVAVMGINKTIEREGKDRDFITLPEDQQEFLRELYHVNKNIVLVLVAGSPMSILWEDKNIPAIVNAWYPGESGGTAVADVLFGKYNPAGRMPVTTHNRIEDLPAFDDYDITKRTYKYYEGDVLYPFGHGLSYTSFKYSDLKVKDAGQTVDVTFTLKNVGRYDGDEVAQVYVRLPEYEGTAPIKELRGFKRVHLKKGESSTVTIPLRREDLRYWSESQKKFIIPEGLPEVMVGASSADIRLMTK
ncbi:MAG: glycoside hydrolase family 3 C-terminal domain-containing protein [Bacteroidales bacterium]|nr:glycoside hydrolase family 3 C-terminal domain-containing protein [Bacteroidales bacterium]